MTYRYKQRIQIRCPRCGAPTNSEDCRGAILDGQDVAIRYRRCKRCRIRIRTEERINWDKWEKAEVKRGR